MNTKHGIFLAMFGLLVFCAFIGSTSAATIYVPDDYANIQLAVNNASAGDTVIVRDGTYTENVFVNKHLTIRSENGSANCAVQAKYSRNHVFQVAAYYVNISGFTVRGATYPYNIAIGGIYLGGSCYCNISGNYISNNNLGIYLRHSSRNLLTNNRVKNNRWGIYSWESSENIFGNNTILNSRYDGIYFTSLSRNNILKNNNILNNGDKGIQLDSSSGNKIYLNSVTNNTDNIDIDLGSYGTTWNSPSKITYMYKGKTYENYLGNYWDDYTGSDADGDGIGDTPYSIDSDKDNYPLMQPWENYFAPTRNIFDTGQPENPYPSIFGTHTGKIKPNHDVIVNTIYTYSCPRTGGHTEYVRFENESWNVTAKWDGYKGDWHNITFDEPFTLYAGLTYNYTIITGSYPQIHHNKTLTVPDGEITCSEFIDANRKRYDDWIPAIRLV